MHLAMTVEIDPTALIAAITSSLRSTYVTQVRAPRRCDATGTFVDLDNG